MGTVLTPGTSLVPMAIELVKQRRSGLLVNVELDYSKPLVKKLLQGHINAVKYISDNNAEAQKAANEQLGALSGKPLKEEILAAQAKAPSGKRPGGRT